MFRFMTHSFPTRKVSVCCLFIFSLPRNYILYLRDPRAYQSRVRIIFKGWGNYKEIYNMGFSSTFYRTSVTVLSWCWCTSRFQDFSTLENIILHKSFRASWRNCKGHSQEGCSGTNNTNSYSAVYNLLRRKSKQVSNEKFLKTFRRWA